MSCFSHQKTTAPPAYLPPRQLPQSVDCVSYCIGRPSNHSKSTMANQPIQIRQCLCSWKECKDIQKQLIQQGDGFGGYVRLSLKGQHEFRSVVEKCTSCAAGSIKEGRLFLAKHHYTKEQLSFQEKVKNEKGNQILRSTPITLAGNYITKHPACPRLLFKLT
jgi:hypothetical protein